jgi:hypothetical protein
MDIPSTQVSMFVPLQQGEGSPRGWAAYQVRYHVVILTWCRRRELSSACAEDLTQEIWLKLLKKIHTCNPEAGQLAEGCRRQQPDRLLEPAPRPSRSGWPA